MKLKKLIALGMTMVMTTGLLVGCGNNDQSETSENDSEKVFKIGMVTDTGGVNDQSFNQSAWEGLQKLRDEVGEDKVKVSYKESKQSADYVSNLDAYVEEEYDLIIGVGYLMQDALKEAAENYPDNQFALVDGGYDEPIDNITTLGFEDNVSSYLVGLIAGKMSDTGKVGFIGGGESVTIDRFKYGFMAGVKDANPDAEINAQYANSYDDVAKGRAMATQMHSDGVDIIFTAAGALGNGPIEVAKENGKKAIGVDKDQNSLGEDTVITSAMKRVDVAVYNLGMQIIDGTYVGGQHIESTLADGGVGIAPTSDKNCPPDVLAYVEEQSQKIIAGEIDVPENKEEYEAKYGN